MTGVFVNMISNNEDRTFLNRFNNTGFRQADPQKYSWMNADAMFKKIISNTTFTNYFYKTEFERLHSIAKLMANFNIEILTFIFIKKNYSPGVVLKNVDYRIYNNECLVITAGFSIPINSKIVGAMSPKTPS